MGGDWRVTVELDNHVDADAVELWLAEVLDDLEISREKSTIWIYADDLHRAAEAEDAVAHLSTELDSEPKALVERWNPGADEWQDPSLPVEAAQPGQPDPSEIDFESLTYEVAVHCSERISNDRVESLQREGLAVFCWGGRRLWAGTATRDEAEELADRLRVESPTGSSVRIRKLTKWRRWLAEEALVGNYAAGSGGDAGW